MQTFSDIYRELNHYADALAASPLGRIRLHQSPLRASVTGQLFVQFDGSYSSRAAGIGWPVWAGENSDFDQIPVTGLVADGSWSIPPTSAIDAEVAAASVMAFIEGLVTGSALHAVAACRAPPHAGQRSRLQS